MSASFRSMRACSFPDRVLERAARNASRARSGTRVCVELPQRRVEEVVAAQLPRLLQPRDFTYAGLGSLDTGDDGGTVEFVYR